MAEKIPSWIERLLLPRLSSMEGELKAINTRIDSMGERIESLRNSMGERIESLRNEMMSMKAELKADIQRVDSSVKDLDKRLDIVQRLAIVEAKLREQEKRSV